MCVCLMQFSLVAIPERGPPACLTIIIVQSIKLTHDYSSLLILWGESNSSSAAECNDVQFNIILCMPSLAQLYIAPNLNSSLLAFF
jgi:hypothetical protein